MSDARWNPLIAAIDFAILGRWNLTHDRDSCTVHRCPKKRPRKNLRNSRKKPTPLKAWSASAERSWCNRAPMSPYTERDRVSTPSVAPNEADAAFALNASARSSSMLEDGCGLRLANHRSRRRGDEGVGTFSPITCFQSPVTVHHGNIFAVSDVPPIDVTVLTRRNRARTAVTVRASPAVEVDVSMSANSASTSAIAPCRRMLIALGLLPKIVCHRTVCP